jgi:hypothetical protein
MKVARVPFFALTLTAFAISTASRTNAANPTSAVDGAAAAAQETTPTPHSPWGWLQMPKVTMPKITMPKMPENAFAPVKASAKKVSDGTKKAWEGTKEIFTLGGDKPAKPAASSAAEPKEPFWKRMFGGEEKKEPEGPQTVAEWMSQPRLDP